MTDKEWCYKNFKKHQKQERTEINCRKPMDPVEDNGEMFSQNIQNKDQGKNCQRENNTMENK